MLDSYEELERNIRTLYCMWQKRVCFRAMLAHERTTREKMREHWLCWLGHVMRKDDETLVRSIVRLRLGSKAGFDRVWHG